MAKTQFIRDAQLERLRANIGPNLERYKLDTPWLAEYFGAEPWFLQSSIEVSPDITLQGPVSKSEHFDLENAKHLYLALRHLTPLQAADDRLWVYMTHVTHWDYMRKRWPLEEYEKKKDKDPVSYVNDRYFLMGDRARGLIRNGLARLWWYGFSTYDETRDDPFELTAVLLKNLDVTQTVLERSFSRNRAVTRALLSVLADREKRGNAFYDREGVRRLAKHLVHIGGVAVIDALPFEEMRGMIDAKVSDLVAT